MEIQQGSLSPTFNNHKNEFSLSQNMTTWRPGYSPVGSPPDREVISPRRLGTSYETAISFVEDKATSRSQFRKVIFVKALYDFVKRKELELSLKRGDIITVIEKNPSGWWKGLLNGQIGKFPVNYCTVIDNEQVLRELQQRAAEESSKIKVVALYNYKSRKNAELTLRRGDIVTVIEQNKSGWWKVKII